MLSALKDSLKRVAVATAPEWTATVVAARARAHSHEILKAWGYDVLTARLLEHCGNRVLSGPFAGMSLTEMSWEEHLGPFLLGVYESELDSVWDFVLKQRYAQILDIGAKFGYYAIGLARHFPQTPVFAFDVDPWARRAIREMAVNNETPNVSVLGYCESTWLSRHLVEDALLVSDCEGFEATLFAPSHLGLFRRATLIVETHDDAVPGITDRLRTDLAPTHIVTVIDGQAPRRGPDRPLDFLTPEQRPLAVGEIRTLPAWIFAVPRPPALP